jgi:hypothetical protein
MSTMHSSPAPTRNNVSLVARLLRALLAACLATASGVATRVVRHLVRGEFACLLPRLGTAFRIALTTLNVADDFQPVEPLPPYVVERIAVTLADRGRPEHPS